MTAETTKIVLMLFIAGCAIANARRYDHGHVKWWALKFAFFIFGSAASVAEPTQVWGIASLGMAAVTGALLAAHVYELIDLRPGQREDYSRPFGSIINNP